MAMAILPIVQGGDPAFVPRVRFPEHGLSVAVR
jgi:hypothetical protein